MIYMREETAPGASAGDNVQDNIAVPPKRRKPKGLIPGTPNYSCAATLKQVLNAAQKMSEEVARPYLLSHFKYHRWGKIARAEIASDPYLGLSIYRYRAIADELRVFNFGHLEAMVTETHRIRSGALEGDMPAAQKDIGELAMRWKDCSDRRKVFAMFGGILWSVWATQASAN
jgi:hypothetical protein